jgi:hypothetical protein
VQSATLSILVPVTFIQSPMKKLFLLLLTIISISAYAQLTTGAIGGNKKAWVGEKIGVTAITINYDRPGVKGREGKIWGELVHYGFKDLGYGTSKASPWRAGANENTTIEFSTAVKIEGKDLPAGKYGFFIEVQPNECTLIFSRRSTAWGSYFYDEKEDALRVKVKQQVQDRSQEWLAYEFSDQTDNSAVISLVWEKWRIPFKVDADVAKNQLEVFRQELTSGKSGDKDNWVQAARFAVLNGGDLQEALTWADFAISGQFVGEANFNTLSTKADILTKLNRNKEADSLMQKALPFGTMQEIHAYGRNLLAQKRTKEALEVFKLNHQKNPNQFTTLMGLTRGYSAVGDYKNALKFAQLAQPLAPNEMNKNNVTAAIEKLKKGQDMN